MQNQSSHARRGAKDLSPGACTTLDRQPQQQQRGPERSRAGQKLADARSIASLAVEMPPFRSGKLQQMDWL